MAIAAVLQMAATHATKSHYLGYSSARASGDVFDVRNGPAASDAVLTVNYQGNLAIDGTFTPTGVVLAANGAVGAPGLSFASDTDCGLYRIGANNVGLAVNGAKVLDVGTTGLGVVGVLLLGDGAVGAPAYSFTSDTNSGFYRIGADNIGLALNGAKVVDYATSGVTVTGTVTGGTYNGQTISATAALTGSLTVATTLGVTGVSTLTGDVIASVIRRGTSDGSDNSLIEISAGGAVGASRGAFVLLHGNEHANTGQLNLAAGNVSGGTITFATGGSTRGLWSDAGILHINDTSNADMTIGLTVNQGAADNHIISLKSSDVAHGITSNVETDTFGAVKKRDATAGGVQYEGYSSGTRAIGYFACGATDNTTKATTADAYVYYDIRKKSGTGDGAVGADGNLLAIGAGATCRFIFDVEGSAHADVEWVAFDGHNDLVVLESAESLLAPGQVQRRFGEAVQHDRAFFEREKLIHDIREVSPGRWRGMVNTTRMMMLHSGAIRQVGGRALALEAALREIVAANPGLNGADRAIALLEA